MTLCRPRVIPLSKLDLQLLLHEPFSLPAWRLLSSAELPSPMHAQTQLPRDAEAEEAKEADPLADLESFFEKQLVIVGGFGASSQGPAGGKAQQWRSMWDAFKQYGDGGDPAKEEIERARGCNHYCGDCHALTMATTSGTPQWSQLQFGPEAHELMQRTGHSITSLQQGGRLLLFGGRNLQREGVSAEMNDAWLLELLPARGAPLLRELFAAGTPPSARAHHSATLLGEAVYVLGGAASGERPLRDAHVLDVSSMSWSQPEVRDPASRHAGGGGGGGGDGGATPFV